MEKEASMNSMTNTVVLLLGASLLAAPLSAQKATAATPVVATPAVEQATRPLMSRVVVIGASLSNGFASGLKLASALDPGIKIEHTRVRDYSTSAFFMNPRRYGKQVMDRALKKKPTLLVGLDYTFWYGYGYVFPRDVADNTGLRPSKEVLAKKTLAMRLAKFEVGLAQLDRYTGPLVLGDIPDMTGADPKMLSRNQIPTEPELLALNKRLAEWVEARRKKGKKTMLFSLGSMVSMMKANKLMLPATPDGKHRARALSGKEVMTWDKLHPSKVGVVLLVGKLYDQMKTYFGKDVEGQLAYDIWKEFDNRNVLGKLLYPLEEDAGSKKSPSSQPGK
jgi:hypothetical protein